MGRLILHIGTHKTGTTSIQRNLSRNRALLEERGIFYPSYDIIDRKNHYAHLGIVNAFSHAHKQMTRDDAIRFFEVVSKRSANFDATILSAESFFRHVGFSKSGSTQKEQRDPDVYWPSRLDYIQDVRAHFPTDDIEIVMVVRRQAEYGASLYQEQIKVQKFRQDFAAFRENFWFRFDYLRQARAWAKVFGKVHVLRFEDLVSSGDIVDNFGHAIGVPFGDLSTAPKENISFAPDLVVLKRMMHQSELSDGAVRDRITQILKGPFKDRLSQMPERSLYTDLKDMKSFQKSFDDGNELLKREFLPESAQSQPMFATGFKENFEFGDALSPQFLEQVLIQLESS